jgi:predicted ArsR family transcriptional regulator
VKNVVRLGGAHAEETVLGFLKRHGSAPTDVIAGRFGWTESQARSELRRLEGEGAVSGSLEPRTKGLGTAGRVLVWRLPG